MILFSTPECRYLADQLPFEKGQSTIAQFSDGEWFVRIDQDVKNKKVWILAATNPPADSIIILLLLLDALQRAGARLHLLFTYFGYARQDRAERGQALAGKVMADMIKQFSVQSIKVIHMHSARMQEYLTYTNCIPLDLFAIPAGSVDVIAAPDKGAHDLARLVGQAAGLETVYLSKERPHQEEVEITAIKGNVNGMRVLIVDDMITTGNTVIHAAQALILQGAISVSVCATHGIFSADARARLQSSCIKQVYVTNTLPQPQDKQDTIEILNCAPFIESLLD